MAKRSQGRDLRRHVQTLVRRLGVLADDKTPCGKDMPVSDAHALQLLREHGPLPQTALQRLLGLDKSSVSRLRARLEGSGRVESVPSRDRGRAITVLKLTLAGRNLADELDGASGERFALVLQHVPSSKRAGVLGALEILNRALGQIDPAGTAEAEALANARSVVDAKDQLLSPRERDVLPLAAQGLRSWQIAERLSIGQRTVETHRAHIARKLGVKGPIELFKYAVEHGLISARSKKPTRRSRRK